MSIIQDIAHSFYSSAFYQEVAHQRRGAGMKLVATLTVIMVVLLMAGMLPSIPVIKAFVQEIPEKAALLPQATWKDGRLSIDKPVPYEINLGTAQQPLLIMIDTDYKLTSLDGLAKYLKDNKVIALLTAENIITLKDQNENLEVMNYKGLNQTITHDQWIQYAKTVAHKGMQIFWIALPLILLFSFFISNLIITLLTTLLVLLLGFLMSARLDFAAAMRVTAAFRLPVNILVYLALALQAHVLTGGLAWLLWLGYLIFGVWSSRPHGGIVAR